MSRLWPSSRYALFAICLIISIALLVMNFWPFVMRNVDSVRLLQRPAVDVGSAANARPYLRAAVALNESKISLALELFSRADHSSQLVRGQYARALSRQPQGWRSALKMMAEEEPLLRYVLRDLLVQHIKELTSEELDYWRERLRYEDHLLLMDVALELLVQGNNDEAEKWAQALPDFATSPDARRIFGQAKLNSNNYAESVRIFRELYDEDGNSLNAYWYGRALLLNGEYELSIVMLKQAADTTTQARAWYLADLALAYGLGGHCSLANPTADNAFTLGKSSDALIARVEQVKETIDSVCP